MWSALSAAARIALDESHAMSARATVYSPTLGVLQLPISDGQVVGDATSSVRWTGTLQADPTYWPQSPTDLLAPWGSEVLIEYGIGLRTGDFEWVPCGRYRLARTSRDRPAPDDTTVQLVDRSKVVADDRFDAPTQTVSGALTTVEIRRLIQETLGTGVAVVDQTGSAQVAAQIELPRERWDGVETLALSIGAEVYFDRLGAGVIRPQPVLSSSWVWQIRTGPTANIVAADDVLDSEPVYNRWLVVGRDGISAVVTDDDPTSPTRWGGPFGKKSRRYSSDTLTTTGMCTTAGQALLARSKGAAVQVSYTNFVNPAADPGDVWMAVDEDVTRLIILDRVPIPLGPEGTQQIGTRSVDLPPEQ
jgi:hypothetical protein